MAQFTTSQEAMAQAAVKVDDAVNAIQEYINGLRGDVDTMLGGWRGDAANQFVQMHTAFEEQAFKINGGLVAMHDVLRGSQTIHGTSGGRPDASQPQTRRNHQQRLSAEGD